MKLWISLMMALVVSVGVYPYGTDDAIDVSMSGIMAQKLRLKVLAENIANATTLMTDTGEPYRKKYVVLESDKHGVKATGIHRSDATFTRVYDPSSPFSNSEGFLLLPNVNLMEELVNLGYTNLVYESNTAAYKSSKTMYQQSLELLK